MDKKIIFIAFRAQTWAKGFLSNRTQNAHFIGVLYALFKTSLSSFEKSGSPSVIEIALQIPQSTMKLKLRR